MDRVVRKLGAKKRMPGPNDIPGTIWALAMRIGEGGKAEDSPSAYRPICLLDEAGKLFERIIYSRLVRHLSRDSSTLRKEQYGFQERRSSVDVILRVRSLLEAEAIGEPPRTRIRINNVSVKAGPTLKYLGLVMDVTWGFHKHFEFLAPKLGKVANMLGTLLPNLGGPKRKARWLYVGVVYSIALYGTSIWASEMATKQHIIALGHRAQRSSRVEETKNIWPGPYVWLKSRPIIASLGETSTWRERPACQDGKSPRLSGPVYRNV
ncbi:uncharacterized protein LOC116852651 [Odontomachus brunneus]|uniref:uncharacterized protein LOC116852651 n=1 Tax=Odontomachus brunneus TaxID=486640 RepID=UPI0013F22F80|nr:uncharacterized protein LOC116852651 [Odontomachus brunneus]